MRRVSSNAQSSAGREKPSRFSVLFVCFIFFSSAAGAIAESLSLSLGGVWIDFVWVPVEGSDGFKQVEIGDFGGGRAKERKRSESIYAPFERNGQRGYYLGKTEVSQEQWAAVMGEGERTKLPVVGKTYAEVQLFLDKINSLVRQSGEVPSTPDGAQGVVKLPTEAEWEYAARGGEWSGYGEADPYGEDLERYEVFSLPGSDGKAKEIGSRPPNQLGLHDMLGNVRELMEGNYSVGGVAGGGLLLKGGSYLSEKGDLRSSSRTEHQRTGKDGKPTQRPDAGLRLAISAEIVTSLGSELPDSSKPSAVSQDASFGTTAVSPSEPLNKAKPETAPQPMPVVGRGEDGTTVITFPTGQSSYLPPGKGLLGPSSDPSSQVPFVNEEGWMVAVNEQPATESSLIHVYISGADGLFSEIKDFNARVTTAAPSMKLNPYFLRVESVSGNTLLVESSDFESHDCRFEVRMRRDGGISAISLTSPASGDEEKRGRAFREPQGQASAPMPVKVMVIGDSLSVGPFGRALESALQTRFGRGEVCVFASCGSSPEDWLPGKPTFVTSCGYRQTTPSDAISLKYQNGKPPRPVRTPKLPQIFSAWRPQLVIVQLGTNWLDDLSRPNHSSPAHYRSIVREFIRELRRYDSVPVFWVLPPASSIHPSTVHATVEQWINEESRQSGVYTVSSRSLSGPYALGASGDDGVNYGDLAGEALARGVSGKIFGALRVLELGPSKDRNAATSESSPQNRSSSLGDLKGFELFEVVRRLEFPNGYSIYNDDGTLIKKVAGPAQLQSRGVSRSKIFAPEGAFLSDWSYEKLLKGEKPNWVVGEAVDAPPATIDSVAEDPGAGEGPIASRGIASGRHGTQQERERAERSARDPSELRFIPDMVVASDNSSFFQLGPRQAGGPDLSLRKGDAVMLLRKEFGYSRVQLPSGKAGFMANEDLEPAPTPPDSAQAKPVLQPPTGPFYRPADKFPKNVAGLKIVGRFVVSGSIDLNSLGSGNVQYLPPYYLEADTDSGERGNGRWFYPKNKDLQLGERYVFTEQQPLTVVRKTSFTGNYDVLFPENE